DTPYIVTATDFGFADVDGNTMTQVQITTLEAVGALQLSGLDVILNQVISRTDIDAGNLRYTPVPDGNGTGYDSFGFRVHDGTVYSLNSYSMSVDVTGVNDAPIAVADSDSTAEDFPVTTLNVLLNDTDVDGDLLSVSTADTSSANGALVTNNSNGTFVYNPPLNFNGSDSFGYTVSDGKGGTAVGTVTITVGPINDPPVALDDGGFTQQRASLRSSSVEVAGTSVLPSVNANGRFVTFWSDDPALVANDKNGVFDLYIRDTLNDLTVRATVNSAGVEADTGEKIPALLHTAAISADSRYVLFESRATNLGTQNLGPYYSELYTFDRLGATTTAMLLGCKGGGPNGDSYEADATPDFNTFVFTSLATDPWPACWTITDVNKVSDIYLRRFNTSLYMRVSVDSKGGEANGASFHPSLSDDGLVVAFASSASNLIVGDTNGVDDILLKNVPDGVVTRVSVDSLGKESDGHSWGPSISADGTRIAFVSSATNLVGGDANGVADIFLHDASTGTTRRISVDSLGVEAKGPSDAPHISKDGRFVTFVSQASNLVADDLNGVADLFVHDTVSGQTRRLSLNTLGVEANGASATPRFSGDGRHVVYGSAADNLVSVDKNALDDAFITTMTEITTVAQFSVTTPNLMLNDSDVDSTFAIKGFTQPSNGSVTDNGNATFDYLPNVGVVGIDAFSYTINDGALADTAWVWLASETANFPPNGVADSATTISPNQVTITVLANDFDLDGDKLTVSAADASSINGGKVTLNLDDTITFSPGSLGLDSFTYTVTDGVASSVVAVTVNVQ
ncbi:MAG: tandem-95 repeat protein, partial [Chromatiales bacterium]|nr:tandem-95 repeat protein [Chromatiales bacterium]